MPKTFAIVTEIKVSSSVVRNVRNNRTSCHTKAPDSIFRNDTRCGMWKIHHDVLPIWKNIMVPVMFCHFWHNIMNGDHDVFPYPMFSNFPPLVLWWWNDCKNDIHHHSCVHSRVYRESQGLSQSFSCINSHNNMVNLFLYLIVILIVDKSWLKPQLLILAYRLQLRDINKWMTFWTAVISLFITVNVMVPKQNWNDHFCSPNKLHPHCTLWCKHVVATCFHNM